MDSTLVTTKEAAELLRVTTMHVGRLVRQGKLSARKTTPRKTLITRDSIEAMINENNHNK